jgi:hypothetical protein
MTLLGTTVRRPIILVLPLAIDSLTTDPNTSVAKQRIWAGLVAEWVGCKSRAEALCHSKGGLKVYRIVHWHIPINNSLLCVPFQKNMWESVNCTCSIMVSVESLNVIL